MSFFDPEILHEAAKRRQRDAEARAEYWRKVLNQKARYTMVETGVQKARRWGLDFNLCLNVEHLGPNHYRGF